LPPRRVTVSARGSACAGSTAATEPGREDACGGQARHELALGHRDGAAPAVAHASRRRSGRDPSSGPRSPATLATGPAADGRSCQCCVISRD
jgi:hypothetical protein